MFAYAGSAVTQHPFGNWSLLFARQPEPDLDFEEDLVEETQQLGGQSPKTGKAPKKKGASPIMWVLLLALLGAGAYFAMDPDGAMNLVNSLIGGEPAPVAQAPSSPKAVPPRPPIAAPAPTTQAPVAAAPSAPSTSAPDPGTPAPQAAPPSAPPVAAMPPMPAPAPMTAMKPANPLYGEGQRVTVSSLGSLTLSQDATGRIPGPSVKPGSPLVVLDGDFQPTGWVYNVRTETGAKGWVPEKLLKAMP